MAKRERGEKQLVGHTTDQKWNQAMHNTQQKPDPRYMFSRLTVEHTQKQKTVQEQWKRQLQNFSGTLRNNHAEGWQDGCSLAKETRGKHADSYTPSNISMESKPG